MASAARDNATSRVPVGTLVAELDLALQEAYACQFVTGTLSGTLKRALGALIEARQRGEVASVDLVERIDAARLAFKQPRTLPGVQPAYGHKTTRRRTSRRRGPHVVCCQTSKGSRRTRRQQLTLF